MAGQPTKLNAKLTKRICNVLRKGASARIACGAAGISVPSYCTWRSKGQKDIEEGKPETLAAQFFVQTEEAKSARAIADLDLLEQALDGELGLDPKSRCDIARFRLTHIDRMDYATKTTNETTVNGAVSHTTSDTCSALLAMLTGQIEEPSDKAATDDDE